MPGIAGIVTKLPRERAERELCRMVESIRHEPFYVTGTWADETLGLYVGWCAREKSFAERMPIFNEHGTAFLIFSGEEFPLPGTEGSLKRGGHQFEQGGATYLAHFCEGDESFPTRLNGRFHGLLVDRTRGTATLFNDRYGLHRIYYHESQDAFYFAAEAKAILAVRPELRSVDPQGLGEFVACGCVLENRTVFKRIHVLPPAATWVCREGALEQKRTYFQPREWEEQAPLEPESYYQEVREVFSRNLPRYFSAQERIGMSLTGGLDTRMIMAWQKSPHGSVPCYTFGGMFRDCQDVVIAREVARVCGQTYQVIPIVKEFLLRFPHYAERSVYLSDACTSVENSPDLYLNEQARQIAPVRMTGNYGGEVLRRVRAFRPSQPLPGLFSDEFVPYTHQAAETYASLLHCHPLSFAVFRQAPWHHYGLLSLEQTQLCLRSPYLDNEFVRTVFRAPESACGNNDVSLRLIADGDPALIRIRTDRGLAGDLGSVLSLVSRRLLDFTFKAEYAYDYGMPQSVARIDRLFSSLRLERLFLGRHKFAHFRVWYRDDLSGYVREMLLDPRSLSRPYLKKKTAETIVNRHLNGGHNYTHEIHQLLTLELLQRLFLDGR